MSKLLLIGGVCLVVALLYAVGECIYNVYFHPLRKYPGPLLWRATRLGFCYKLLKGTIPFDVHALHQQYGPVVRIAPDHLAFADPQAWKDIMGHHSNNSNTSQANGAVAGGATSGEEMTKYEKYYSPIAGTPVTLINAPREYHGRMRRALAHGFSEKRIREQEDIIGKYIDLLMSKLGEKSGADGEVPLDMTAWYNFALFDVIGDLTFGEPFGCLEDSEYHPWIKSFFSMARTGSYLYAMAWWPTLQKALMLMTPPRVWLEQIQLYTQSVNKLKKRMEYDGKRPDLIQCLLDNQEKLDIDIRGLEANSTLLVVAGAETTATLLSGVTYFLLKNPEALKKLSDEVREAFQSESEITFSATSNLPYLKACLDEALRLYPPTPGGLPRTVPEGGAVIAGSYVPEKTAVSIYQYAMNRSERLWTMASEFHPERFLGDFRFAGDQGDALQPFHLGPRSCLGRNLANLEMRIILARLVWKFDMQLAQSSEEWLEGQKVFDVWGKPPLNVHLTPVSR